MPDGSYEPLQHKNIDTGAVLNDWLPYCNIAKPTLKRIWFFPIIEALQNALVLNTTKSKYRCLLKGYCWPCTCCDSIDFRWCITINEGRGYVLRRILRRAVTSWPFAWYRGLFLTPVIDVVVDILGPWYQIHCWKQDFVKRVVQNEEERFNQTLEQGLELFSLIDTLAAEKATEFLVQKYSNYMIHMDSLGINRRNRIRTRFYNRPWRLWRYERTTWTRSWSSRKRRC